MGMEGKRVKMMKQYIDEMLVILPLKKIIKTSGTGCNLCGPSLTEEITKTKTGSTL